MSRLLGSCLIAVASTASALQVDLLFRNISANSVQIEAILPISIPLDAREAGAQLEIQSFYGGADGLPVVAAHSLAVVAMEWSVWRKLESTKDFCCDEDMIKEKRCTAVGEVVGPPGFMKTPVTSKIQDRPIVLPVTQDGFYAIGIANCAGELGSHIKVIASAKSAHGYLAPEIYHTLPVL